MDSRLHETDRTDDMPDLKLSMFAIAALFRIHFICYLPKGRLKTVRLVLAKFLLKSNALSLSDDIAMQAHTLVWFRRNLRIRDNAALSAAVKRGLPVAGVWVAQGSSEIPNPRQDWFHYQAAAALHRSLAARGVALYAVSRVEELPALATRLNVQTVIADEAYTSSEIGQDNRIWRILDEQGVAFERVTTVPYSPRQKSWAVTARLIPTSRIIKKRGWLCFGSGSAGGMREADTLKFFRRPLLKCRHFLRGTGSRIWFPHSAAEKMKRTNNGGSLKKISGFIRL